VTITPVNVRLAPTCLRRSRWGLYNSPPAADLQ